MWRSRRVPVITPEFLIFLKNSMWLVGSSVLQNVEADLAHCYVNGATTYLGFLCRI
jgi:hypothetical protein